nr:hypothetical protein [Mycoplasmopsis bovis]
MLLTEKNIATNFSSYAKNYYGSYPLVSAYGNTLNNDKAGLLKSYYHKNNYNEIEKYIKSSKNNKEFIDKISYSLTKQKAPQVSTDCYPVIICAYMSI